MPIEDVFAIPGCGTVVVGKVERGVLKVMDPVEIVGIKPARQTVAASLEMSNKPLKDVRAGENVGILLENIEKDEIERGQVLAQPDSIIPRSKFKAQIYCLSKEEGGRHSPFFAGYRPQFYFRTTDITGTVDIPGGKGMVMPGDNTEILCELIHPIALEKGSLFSIREGGKTIASGQVVKILG
jgi:elongation factor Tu